MDWHVRCRDCGDVGMWLTHHQAWGWVQTHLCPPPEIQPSTTQPERTQPA